MELLIILLVVIIVLFVVGGLVVGVALNLLWWALIGLLIGALARLVVPGAQAMSWLATALYGVAGALLGGIIADALDVGNVLQFVIAVLVAAGLIAVLGGGRRATA
jgi:uncharacterized membrane protein YeaQ/YmgE (transglycosylase-associated protein family)